jgi:RloB-like protein
MGRDKAPWNQRAQKPTRKSRKLDVHEGILIVCEGTETEPNYFRSFPVVNKTLKIIGSGYNTSSLVKLAVKEWETLAKDGSYYEQLWCVFDRDSFSQGSYNGAFLQIDNEAKRLNRKYAKWIGRDVKVKAAYSNEAFELWVLLHYQYITSGLDRNQYGKKLKSFMGTKYKKNDPEMYEKLSRLTDESKGKGQQFAIKNAHKLLTKASDSKMHNTNPSTTVHLLVEELNKHLKK